jgi:hypothetical protein
MLENPAPLATAASIGVKKVVAVIRVVTCTALARSVLLPVPHINGSMNAGNAPAWLAVGGALDEFRA